MKKIVIVLITFLTFQFSFSQKKEFENVSLDKLITETQYSSDSTESIDLIWWIPTEYWNVVFSQDKTVSKSESEAIINLLKNYVTIIAVKGKVGLFGGVTYASKDSIQSSLKVKFKTEELQLENEKNYDPDLLNFLSLIKPMMSNMLGPMGENMQVFLFKNPGFKKILPVDPYSSENLYFSLGDFENVVELPLGSLLKEKVCKECNKMLNGKWSYCPYDGTELSLADN
ncbi:hypothetical protein [Hyunsoonleella rubra]|uniref:Uncharacterized protein n=1 Tax=Hyunsoonleella rubra TaxID=1737062 RepID=A0ABW5TA45_9FLAO